MSGWRAAETAIIASCRVSRPLGCVPFDAMYSPNYLHCLKMDINAERRLLNIAREIDEVLTVTDEETCRAYTV